MTTAERITVKLTKRQADQVSWALDPMDDHWCTDDGAWERGGEVLPDSDMPTLVEGVLTLSPVPDVNDDLLYRLEVQLQDMTRGETRARPATEFPKEHGIARAAMNAARIIRQALAGCANEK